MLDELGAGDKPRLVAFNKADLLDRSARDGNVPAPAIAGSVFVSALTGYGIDTLRAEIAALLASLWVDVDVSLPYAAGELLARVRERGTIELEYGERDVRVRGRVAPSLAGELEGAAARWAETAGRHARGHRDREVGPWFVAADGRRSPMAARSPGRSRTVGADGDGGPPRCVTAG